MSDKKKEPKQTECGCSHGPLSVIKRVVKNARDKKKLTK